MRIKVEETLGLIIDIQEKLFPHIDENEMIAKNTETLVKGLKILNVPILVTEQYTKGLGFTIPNVDKALGEYNAIEKMSFSCCDDGNFRGEIRQLHKKFVIIAGIETHVCVLQTALDMMEGDYQPVVVEDCVSSRTEKDKRYAIERMRQAGVIITTYESILFELTRVSGTEKFKSISKLLK